MPKTDPKDTALNDEVITCYVLGKPIKLPYEGAPSQLEVERTFPTGKMIPIFMDKAEVDQLNISGNVHIDTLRKVQPIFLIQINRGNLSLRIEQEDSFSQAVAQIYKTAVYTTDDGVTCMRPTNGEASKPIYIKRKDVIIITKVYINPTKQTPYLDPKIYTFEFGMAMGGWPSSVDFPGVQFFLNKAPLQIGLSKSVQPYVDAWNTAIGDCRIKTCAVLFKYKSGHSRSHLQQASTIQANIADAKSDTPSVYSFFRRVFKSAQENKEKPWTSLQDGDFGAALCTIDTMFTETAICIDYLLALQFINELAQLIIEYADYGNDEKFHPLSAPRAVVTIAVSAGDLGGAAAQSQQSPDVTDSKIDLSTPTLR